MKAAVCKNDLPPKAGAGDVVDMDVASECLLLVRLVYLQKLVPVTL